MTLSFLSKPYFYVLSIFIMGFLCWAVPESSGLDKGFHFNDDVGFYALLYTMFYLAVFACSYVFFQLGKILKIKFPFGNNHYNIFNNQFYYMATFFAFVGVFFVWFLIVRRIGLYDSVSVILKGQANQLKFALYSDYSRWGSLRYISTLTFAIALFRIISNKKIQLIDWLNAALLLLSVVISSRLQLILAIVVFFCLFFRDKKRKVKLLPLIISLSVIFSLLSAFNYSRNKFYYETIENQGFLASSVSEVVKYVGAPFQGAVSAFQFPHKIHQENFDVTVANIHHNLSTNSSILFLGETYSLFIALLIIALTISIMSFLSGCFFSSGTSIYSLMSAVICYCLADIYRVYIFDSGIFISLMGYPFIIQSVAWIVNRFRFWCLFSVKH